MAIQLLVGAIVQAGFRKPARRVPLGRVAGKNYYGHRFSFGTILAWHRIRMKTLMDRRSSCECHE